MNRSDDRQSQAHALWGLRIRNQTKRLKFCVQLILATTAIGAFMMPTQTISPSQIAEATDYGKARVISWLTAGTAAQPKVTVRKFNRTLTVPTWMVLSDAGFDTSATLFRRRALQGGWLGFLLGLGVTMFLTRNIRKSGEETFQDRVIGGTRVVSEARLKALTEAVTTALSVRTAEIDARLEERGTSREKATAVEKQIAALDTRRAKIDTNRETLVADWRATADATGFNQPQRMALIEEAKARAAEPAQRTALIDHRHLVAARAVTFAAEKLGERQSVFSTGALHEEAGRFGLGKVSYSAIALAVANSARNGDLSPRTFIDKRGAEFQGFTTRANIENEKILLRIEANGRGQVAPLVSRIEAAKTVAWTANAAERNGLPWTSDQCLATTRLLSSRNRITAIQGYAGTAKTTTVLATYAHEAAAKRWNLSALAPTASAATVLGEALKMRGDTVARHLLAPETRQHAGPSVWIVDEASMLSARDMAKLMVAAVKADARVILVGDVKQLGSVGAGAAFAQLQGAGMETAKLAEIVRQTNPLTREAVEASIQGDARRALGALDRGGGKIIAHADHGERMREIAKDFAALSARDQRGTIVIDPSRAGRDALNAEIRTRLAASGQLTGEAVAIRTLESKGLTKAEARDARSYEIGDVVCFTRDYPDKGIARHEAVTVKSVDHVKNAVSLERPDGNTVDWRPRQWGASRSESFTPGSAELMKGDRIEFTRNDRSLARANGTRADVIAINPEERTARIRLDNGTFQTLNLDKSTDQHLRHGYAQTAHAAQGRTAERAMIHADSRATNLVDQKMMYVAISRARTSAAVYTDDRTKLVSALNERAGIAQTAIGEAALPSARASKAIGAGLG
jgi:ATP-dependent exoDNAse (exonuclease V) alpha subunit